MTWLLHKAVIDARDMAFTQSGHIDAHDMAFAQAVIDRHYITSIQDGH